MKEPLRAMLDTNTYEVLYKQDPEPVARLVRSGRLIVYGCKVIRDELREIPATVRISGKSYRNMLLSLYDEFTEKHSYPIESLSETLAEEYGQSYKGGVAKRKMMPDFLIVAIATIHGLDIIVSGDEKTMKSGPALKAYTQVNGKKNLETPKFISLEQLVKL